VNEKDKRHYLMENLLVDRKKTNFFHQNKQAKILIGFFPDIEFWKWLICNYDDMKVYTLANLVKPNIIKTLKSREKIKAFSLKERQSYTLSEEKVGNDAIINKPNPNSVFDFIKNGSKKEEK
jgi:hypothetical protein|tara:strand:+ start:4188 stop:4553 length:366 start_codon:yes stop_codon:yes gene_type:complete